MHLLRGGIVRSGFRTSGLFLILASFFVGLGTTAHATFPGLDAQILFQRGTEDSADIWVTSPDGEWSRQLTGAGRDADPSWSPDGNRIAFTGVRGGNSDLYVMNHDGSDLQRVTTSPAVDAYPSWSPDGTRVAFVSDGDVALIDLGSGMVTNLTAGAATNDFREPRFSPDGSRIATWSDGSIYVMNADGSNRRSLTQNSYLQERSPDWSPDGTKLVYASQAYAADNTRDFDIWIMNSDGSNETRISGSSAADEYDPAWSPGGSQIVYYAYDSGDTELFTMYADGSAVTKITDNGAIDSLPSWRSCADEYSCSGYRPSNMHAEVRRRTSVLKVLGGLLEPEKPFAPITVDLYRKSAGSWRLLESKELVLDEEGWFRTSFTRPKRGSCKLAARFDGDFEYKGNTDNTVFYC